MQKNKLRIYLGWISAGRLGWGFCWVLGGLLSWSVVEITTQGSEQNITDESKCKK